MRDIVLLGRLRAREWRSQLLYVFRVLGLDVTHLDWATYSYGFYVIGIAVVWGIVSWAMVLNMMSQIGHPFPYMAIQAISTILTLIAMILIMRGLFHYPFLLPHGDLELIAPTPISRRAMATMALVPRQIKAFLVWGFLGSLTLSFLHLTHVTVWYGSCLFGAWGVMVNVWVYTLSLLRVARPRRPRRFQGFIPLIVIPALFWERRLTTWPAHWVFLGITSSVSPLDPLVAIGTLWLMGWMLMLFLGPRLNLITIQEASEFYADVRSLGTAFLPNPQLVQDMRQRARMRRRRARGSLPNWPFPQWELGRFLLGIWRTPGQGLVLVEIALLLRSGILLVFGVHGGLAWLLWLFFCYRMNRGGMTLYFQRDYGDAFMRQFWPDTAASRVISSTIVPFLVVTILSYLVWVVLPLGVALTPFHALFLFGLIITWHLAESSELVRKVAIGSVTGGREARTLALGILLFLAIPGHRPEVALWVPAILILIAAIRYRSQTRTYTTNVS